MENNFSNPFDLSSCPWGSYYYHWCIYVDDKPILQNKDLTSVDDVRREIFSKSLKGPYKVIRTTDKLNAIIKYINETQLNVFMPEYNEDDIFECDSTFLVDVTLEVSK